MKFKQLLSPVQIGQLHLKNRIVMPGMGLNYATHDGYITEREKAFYKERAAGGVGTIVIGIGCVDLVGKLIPNQICIYDERFIPGLADIVETIHQHGAKALIQLQHGGRLSRRERNGGHQPVAPSPIMQPGVLPGREEPRELSEGEIKDIVNRFAEGAGRAKSAGFDGVEIHAGHGYLIAQFLSGNSNKRQDTYGGHLTNRARFLIEIITAIRKEVGDGYPVWCRIDGREFGIDGGITIDDSKALAVMIEKAGVEAINVSGYGGSTDHHFLEAPLPYMRGALIPLAEAIKKVVKVPVIAVGRISPEMGENVLRQNKADLIAMARQLIAEPQLPDKLASGKLRYIKPCINCYTCVHEIAMGESMCCGVNPFAGRENEMIWTQPDRTKKVMVIGGGPAGMEAAMIAALRGHDVTLYAREHRLGGLLPIAALVKELESEDLSALIAYFKSELARLGIRTRLGKEVSVSEVEAMMPDVIIVAIGGLPTVPEIPGINGFKVVSSAELHQKLRTSLRLFGPRVLRWLTKLWMPLGKKVVIIGGGMQGCQLAEFLIKRGREVSIVEMSCPPSAKMGHFKGIS